MITNFQLYERKRNVDDVQLEILNPEQQVLDEIIAHMSFVIQKRIKRNLRIISITGSMNNRQVQGQTSKTITSLHLLMSNKDQLNITYTYLEQRAQEPTAELEIIINDRLVYQVEKPELVTESWILKVATEYKKYLSTSKWKIQ